MELLKQGSPKSKAFESLRVKIQQQKLERTGKPDVEMTRQFHVIRKVCRVTSKGLYYLWALFQTGNDISQACIK